ncbi:hypothetical protein C453_13181 [Haloferax elongans ATCC BAA-1513]|uniref:BolA family transcriptional regulator n=1 Tax=Haloferax elongans ATCC BAA-1513 TaxID=1230453 RepID=M0HIQ7_HALEO|nr:BolA family protein [Haloferax elongans]ELZ82964.1 hypothetical protein C453_13181 [Haloferax elongans ATCC BAA-1513]
MDIADIEELIESNIEDADATVSRPRSYDENHEDDHYAAVVISPAFEGKPLVQQHQLVYDALGDHMTTDIHAMELKTYTPEEYEAREE